MYTQNLGLVRDIIIKTRIHILCWNNVNIAVQIHVYPKRDCTDAILTLSLENQCLMFKYDKWYIITNLLCSTFGIKKIKFFSTKSSYIVKMFEKNVQKMIKDTF